MSIHHLLNKSVVIRRLSSVAGYRNRYFSTGTVEMHIQRLTEEGTFETYGVEGVTHKAWCDENEDINTGDKCIDPDGNKYDVVAVNQQDYGMNVHLEIVLKKYGDQDYE